MEITKRLLMKLIDEEIKWCKKNYQEKHSNEQKGFIKGLKQAKFLIKKI